MEITFLPTNTSEIQLHVEQLLQNMGKKLPTYLGRAKKKEKTETKE